MAPTSQPSKCAPDTLRTKPAGRLSPMGCLPRRRPDDEGLHGRVPRHHMIEFVGRPNESQHRQSAQHLHGRSGLRERCDEALPTVADPCFRARSHLRRASSSGSNEPPGDRQRGHRRENCSHLISQSLAERDRGALDRQLSARAPRARRGTQPAAGLITMRGIPEVTVNTRGDSRLRLPHYPRNRTRSP